MDIIKLLRKTPIFSTLDSSSLKKIADFFGQRNYSAGEILFKEGTLGDTLYIIKEGEIKTGKEAKEGEEEAGQVFRREGDIFGESGFLDESPRPVTARATKDTLVLQLSRSDFLTIFNDYPQVAYQIVKVTSSRLKQQDLRMVEELREKNEQLQKAYQTLLKMAKTPESPAHVEKGSLFVEETLNFSDRLISTIPLAVICTDENDAILFFSKSAEKEFGYKNEEVMGNPIRMLWSENSWSNICPTIQENLWEENFWQGEVIALKKNGEHFLSFTTVSEIIDDKKGHNGKLYLCQDVTKKRSQESEERLNQELLLRRQLAKEIAHIITGEIKTLANAFETHPFELDQANLNKSMKTLTIMRDALNNIRSLITNINTLNLPEAKKEPLDLASFFAKELLLLKTQEKYSHITFTTHFEEGMAKVEVDRDQFQQLLYTIMDNAAFSLQSVSDRKKGITLEVGCMNQKREIQIQILDNGIGIGAANLSKVFKERFTTKKDGLGLGLLSVARIVNNHGGKIEVESDEGSYTLFIITLPACQEKPASLPQAEQVLKAHR